MEGSFSPSATQNFTVQPVIDLSTVNESDIPGDATYYLNLCLHLYISEFELLMVQIFKLYVNPIISILGFSANMMSIVILRKSGLSKPSNVLLLGMVVADSMTQLKTVNFAEMLQLFGPGYKYPDICGWQYGDTANYFLMSCDIVFLFFSVWGQYVNTSISVIITVERLLAVYMPMTFKKIVTAKTTRISVTVAFVIWLPWVVYTLSNLYPVVQIPGVMLFILFLSRQNRKIYVLLNDYVWSVLSGWVPMVIVGVGCLLIGIKVKFTLVKRKRLTSGKDKVPWSARTTRTLLLTCVFLFISITVSSFVGLFESSLSKSYVVLIGEVMQFTTVLNASCNFFVYIATNKKFYVIFINTIRLNSQSNLFH